MPDERRVGPIIGTVGQPLALCRLPNWLCSVSFWLRSVICFGIGVMVSLLPAAERHGQVKFGGLPLPGATVTAQQGDKKITAITDPGGHYSFPDLPDGAWTIQVEM